MFSKLSTRTLLILMAILAAVVWFTYFNDSNQDDSTFRTVFMELDTTALTAIQLYPKAQNGEEISFTNKGDHWELTDGKVTTQADSQTVQGLIREFANLKSQSLAANSKDQWEAFQVGDTSATRVKLVTPGKTYDVMVGKFGYNEQSRNGLTYVRMYDEDEVYTVSGFLSFTVNQVFNAWRNRNLTNGGQDRWQRIEFMYPGDSSFTMTRETGQWTIDGTPCDSNETRSFLTSIANLNSNAFLDGYSPGATAPAYSIRIQGDHAADVLIQAFPADTTVRFVLHSSLNPDAYFDESKSNIVDRLFVSKDRFLPTE